MSQFAPPQAIVTRGRRTRPEDVNRRIRHDIETRVRYFAEHQDEISTRLRALDQEWDIERALEGSAATIGFTGILLAATVDKRWLALPALVTAFLFQHIVQGWCPPLPILRRLGYRTAREIEIERVALKALRGDFGQAGQNASLDDLAHHALQGADL
jgi:hypothetical protein